MRTQLKTSHTKTTEIVSEETSELLSEETITHTYMTKDKESFFLVYSSLIGLLGELSNPSIKVLSYILLNYRINTQFEIGSVSRDMIAKQMKIGKSSVANALTELKIEKILYSTRQSVYQINPRYAYQGSSADRLGALQAIIKLGCEKC